MKPPSERTDAETERLKASIEEPKWRHYMGISDESARAMGYMIKEP